jgi:DNA polymerase-4
MSGPATGLCRDCFWIGPASSKRCPSCASPRFVVHAELERLTIAHLDCDAFYASVEKRDRPELRDQPVIVGGGVRGVVTTCCYLARVYGVRSAMPMFQALRLCPQAIVIKPDFTKYREVSGRIHEKLALLTPLVQPLSLDEAWLDLTGSERLHGGCAAMTLARLQAEIERDIGVTVSIGLAANKFLAKIASDLDKPRGFSLIAQGEAQAFLAPKPVGVLPGVGPVLAASLEAAGYRTVGDLAKADARALAKRWGAYGLRLASLSRGEDARAVDPDQARKSISAETTFNEDIADLDALEDRLQPLCERVARTARKSGLAGRVVTLKLKRSDFRIITRRRTLAAPTQTSRTIYALARAMLAGEVGAARFRLIGAGLSELTGDADGLDLFAEPERRARRSEQAIDALRARFGAQAVVSGRSLKERD